MSTLSSVCGFVAGLGAGEIATNIALSHIPANAGKLSKICCCAGAIGLGWAASSVADAAVQMQVTKLENLVKAVANHGKDDDGFVNYVEWESV